MFPRAQTLRLMKEVAKLISFLCVFFLNVSVSDIKNLLDTFAPMFIHEVPVLKNKIGSEKNIWEGGSRNV